jgi:hypothetical protein
LLQYLGGGSQTPEHPLTALLQPPATSVIPPPWATSSPNFTTSTLPVGQISCDLMSWPIALVQPSNQKYIYFAFSESMIYSRLFRSEEGAYASSRTWSGMRWTWDVPIDVRRIRGRRSRVVLARPCRRQVCAKLKASRGQRWQTLVHRGERVISRKPLRRECRVVSAEPVGQRASRATVQRADRGCSQHPAFPVPSVF